MRPDDCDWEERDVDGKSVWVPLCPECGVELTDVIREGVYLVRRHTEQGAETTLCQYGYGQAYNTTPGSPTPPTACQAKCPTPDCKGHCVNGKGHPPGHHYCDLAGHGW